MNEKLNIQDLIDLLAEKHGMSKKNADSFVKEFFVASCNNTAPALLFPGRGTGRCGPPLPRG